MTIKISKYSFWYFIIQVVKPFKLLITGQFLIAIIWALDMSIRPYLIKVILDKTKTISSSTTVEILFYPVLLYILMSLIVAIVFRIYDWIIFTLHPNLKKHISLTLINQCMEHSQNFYINNFAGNIANKINDVTNAIPAIFSIFIDRFFSNILAILIAVYTVWSVDFKFAIALACWIIFFLTISIKISKKSKILSDEAAGIRSMVTGHIIDALTNILNIRIFTGKNYEVNYLSKTYDNLVKAEIRKGWFFIKIQVLQESSFIIFLSICLWWLVLGIKNQTITPGDFALILILNISIINSLHLMSRDIGGFAELSGNLIQGLRTINSKVEVQDKPGAKELIAIKGEISFEAVEFYYESTQPIFTNMSLNIYPGQKVGLVGYSGSGKSTFVNLILRLYDTCNGRILIDKQDIKDISQESLRQAISVIPQDTSLFHRTVIENIRYGKPQASDEEVIEASKLSSCHDFICKLPKGYKTILGERGVKLSGGERQCIAIARAILKNAPILILDEATSQLDAITETKIQECLWKLMQNKTTIVIAHRLSTLLGMDRILVFSNGKIIQDGKHSNLLIKNGLYKQLWKSQSNGLFPKKTIY